MHIVLGMLIGILATCTFNFELQAASLDDSVRTAVTSSPAVGEVESVKSAVEEDVAQARGAYLPKADLEASVGPQWADKPRSLASANNRQWSNARQAAFVIRQTLFDGFARDGDLLRQQARLSGAISKVVEQTDTVALAATEAHVDVVRQRQVVKDADTNVAAHRAIQMDVETRYRGGGATVSELEQIRERVAVAEAARADFARSLGVAEARYERVTGRAPATLAVPRAPRTPIPPLDKAVTMAFSENPGLKAASAEIDAALADVDVARARFAPQVGVEVRASRGLDLSYTQGKSNDALARMTMAWNLFNGGIDDSRVRQRMEAANAQRFRLDKLRRELRESLAADWATRTTSGERIAALKRALALARKVTVAYDDEYKAGRRGLLDVLDAKASEFQAKIGLAGAEAIALMAQYRILAASGQIRREFKLAADRPRIAVPMIAAPALQ